MLPSSRISDFLLSILCQRAQQMLFANLPMFWSTRIVSTSVLVYNQFISKGVSLRTSFRQSSSNGTISCYFPRSEILHPGLLEHGIDKKLSWIADRSHVSQAFNVDISKYAKNEDFAGFDSATYSPCVAIPYLHVAVMCITFVIRISTVMLFMYWDVLNTSR